MTFEEALKEALKAVGTGAAIFDEIDDAVGITIKHAGALAKHLDIDVTELLNGDPEHDQAILDAAEIQGALNSGIDWNAVPVAVFETAWTVIKAAMVIAPLL